MKASDATVALTRIDFDDRSCVVTADNQGTTLEVSLKTIGLLNPPVLAERTDGWYRIICGFRRLQAAGRLGWHEVSAKTVDSAATDRDLLSCSLLDNLSHRRFNLVEQAGAVVRLAALYPQQEVVEEWLPRLGLHPTVKTLSDMLALDSLEPQLHQGILRGILTMKSALKLAAMNRHERLAFFDVCSALNLSASKQAELLESCSDIARRDSMTLCDVLGRDDVRDVLENDTITNSQKTDRIRRIVRKLRFPRLSRREQQFDRLIKHLRLPGGSVLRSPPFFEGPVHTMELSFSSADDLRTMCERTLEAAADPALQAYFREGA